MRQSGAVAALIAVLLVLAGPAGASDEPSTRPPQNLKLVGDHWTPWDPPPAAPGAYIIVKGDTLWDLAESWLGDPFLWPQIWDENRYILDSHWIYPGDPLVIPGRPTVVPEGDLPVTETPEVPPEPDTGTPGGEPKPIEPVPLEPAALIPLANPNDIYCAGYIEPEHSYSDVWVAGHEFTERTILAEGDVIYLSQGRNQGIQPGDEFGVIREIHDVKHPDTKESLGSYIQRVARVRVMLVQDNTSTGVIDMSCAEVYNSDELVPWREYDVPPIYSSSMPPFDRYDVTPTGGQLGRIVLLGGDRMAVAEGQIIHTDLGVASGVAPGTVLTLYRDHGELPRAMIGQAVVLTVEPLTSTAKVTTSVRETTVGDNVEVIR